jgi:hypothetical protein
VDAVPAPMILPWLLRMAFGAPVEPEVKMIARQSWGRTDAD